MMFFYQTTSGGQCWSVIGVSVFVSPKLHVKMVLVSKNGKIQIKCT